MWMDSLQTEVGCTHIYKHSLAVLRTASWVSCRLPAWQYSCFDLSLSLSLSLSTKHWSQQVTIRTWPTLYRSSDHSSTSNGDISITYYKTYSHVYKNSLTSRLSFMLHIPCKTDSLGLLQSNTFYNKTSQSDTSRSQVLFSVFLSLPIYRS
jgi:hypothetical protein